MARRHGLNVSLLYRWRRQIEEEQASPSPEPPVSFVPVRIADDPPSIPDDNSVPVPSTGTGVIEIVLSSGHCLRVDRHVDATHHSLSEDGHTVAEEPELSTGKKA